MRTDDCCTDDEIFAEFRAIARRRAGAARNPRAGLLFLAGDLGDSWPIWRSPNNGTDFSLQELQDNVGGYVEIVYLPGSSWIAVVNETGRIDGLPRNVTASLISGRELYGPVIFCPSEAVK